MLWKAGYQSTTSVKHLFGSSVLLPLSSLMHKTFQKLEGIQSPLQRNLHFIQLRDPGQSFIIYSICSTYLEYVTTAVFPAADDSLTLLQRQCWTLAISQFWLLNMPIKQPTQIPSSLRVKPHPNHSYQMKFPPLFTYLAERLHSLSSRHSEWAELCWQFHPSVQDPDIPELKPTSFQIADTQLSSLERFATAHNFQRGGLASTGRAATAHRRAWSAAAQVSRTLGTRESQLEGQGGRPPLSRELTRWGQRGSGDREVRERAAALRGAGEQPFPRLLFLPLPLSDSSRELPTSAPSASHWNQRSQTSCGRRAAGAPRLLIFSSLLSRPGRCRPEAPRPPSPQPKPRPT